MSHACKIFKKLAHTKVDDICEWPKIALDAFSLPLVPCNALVAEASLVRSHFHTLRKKA